MLSRPKQGDQVEIWYATKPKRRGALVPAAFMPHHGRRGRIVIVSTGKPRNHGIELDGGELICVPAGNLRKVQP